MRRFVILSLLVGGLLLATAGSAYVNHLDDTGMLEPGFLADLAVLDRDPFLGESEEIAQAKVVSTWVAGERVLQA